MPPGVPGESEGCGTRHRQVDAEKDTEYTGRCCGKPHHDKNGKHKRDGPRSQKPAPPLVRPFIQSQRNAQPAHQGEQHRHEDRKRHQTGQRIGDKRHCQYHEGQSESAGKPPVAACASTAGESQPELQRPDGQKRGAGHEFHRQGGGKRIENGHETANDHEKAKQGQPFPTRTEKLLFIFDFICGGCHEPSICL